jgi:TPR repeat protein
MVVRPVSVVFALVLAAGAGLAVAAPAAAQTLKIETFDPKNYSQAVTECDRLAAHNEDPFHVAPGVSQAAMDKPAAIKACTEAVKKDPENPRLNYQLGRAYGYSGMGKEAMPYRLKAVEKGYPQSLFVIGWIYYVGQNIEKNVCLGGFLLRESAKVGRIAGQVGFPTYVLDGAFDACPDVKKDWNEMLGFLDAAAKQTGGNYYQELLIANLRTRIKERMKG